MLHALQYQDTIICINKIQGITRVVRMTRTFFAACLLSVWMHLSKEPSNAQGQWRATEKYTTKLNLPTPRHQTQSLHHSGNYHQLVSAAEEGPLGLNEESSDEIPKSCGKETTERSKRWKDELLQLQGLRLLQQLDFSTQLFSGP